MQEVKELLSKNQYDLLLLDVTLPDGTGFEVCEAVRGQGNQVPIIFLTASDEEIIFEELWDGLGNFVDDNTLSVYIRRLREKVEKDPSRPEHLITARGFGYRWQEAAAYGVWGVLFGCMAGLPLNRFCFDKMITFRWGTEWYFPVGPLCVIVAVVLGALMLAVYGSAKRIREMSVVDTISGW